MMTDETVLSLLVLLPNCFFEQGDTAVPFSSGNYALEKDSTAVLCRSALSLVGGLSSEWIMFTVRSTMLPLTESLLKYFIYAVLKACVWEALFAMFSFA